MKKEKKSFTGVDIIPVPHLL